MSSVKNALIRSRSLTNTATALALHMKRAGGLNVFDMGSYGGFGQFQDQAQSRQKYALYRGWVYSAVNALCMEAARQPVVVGREVNEKDKPKGTKNVSPILDAQGYPIKGFEVAKMPQKYRNKAAATNTEVIPDHPLLTKLQHPNSIQHGFQFVYSFVANLNLTGWGYIIGGTDEDSGELEFYSVPTNWITPDHTEGAFAHFWLLNPNNPQAGKGVRLSRENVAFAYLPNPANPMGALAPASAQSLAIKIDDQIQSSQAVFFENAVFPGAIVTMGKNPLGDNRPRLTAAQRRQVYGAIKKVMGGVANYGNPAIVDGMIEKIERLPTADNEIGWEKSEKSVRTRILSAFSVHPFILGEEMAGSYAQAYIVESRFAARVNIFLAMLSELMTAFAPKLFEPAEGKKTGKSKLLVWWEEMKPKDPSMEQIAWSGARARGDVTENEFRAVVLGLPPEEDKNEAVIDKSSVQAVSGVAQAVAGGKMTPEQGTAILIGMGLPDKIAKDIAGKGAPQQPEDAWADNFDEDPYQQALQDAGDEMDGAVKGLMSIEAVITKAQAELVTVDA